MITNEEELAIVREQLTRCDAVIESFRKELLPNHERNFNLYARSWIDMRQELQADIDAYLGTTTVPADGSADKVEPAEANPPDRAGDVRAGGNQVT